MPTFRSVTSDVSCAVEVFIATALLHKEQPGRPGFTKQEILDRVQKENVYGEFRPGISPHISQHCVANIAPSPAKHRILFATGKSTRRLILPSDQADFRRTGKIFPDAEEMPEKYLSLLEWARQRYYGGSFKMKSDQPVSAVHLLPLSPPPVISEEPPIRQHSPLQALLDARGIGIEMARGIDPDEYIRELREGWE